MIKPGDIEHVHRILVDFFREDDIDPMLAMTSMVQLSARMAVHSQVTLSNYRYACEMAYEVESKMDTGTIKKKKFEIVRGTGKGNK